MVRLPLAALLLLAAAPPSAVPVPAGDGASVIRAMHARYEGQWYHTLTFVQTTRFLLPTPRTETWYEAARIPGMLRIDIAPLDSGNAIVFRHDTLYRFRGGQPGAGRPFVHPLMVLGFDVYADPPATTIGKLQGLGFDLSRTHETTWQGTPVIVVGALAGDTTPKQFWVEKERLLFVRLLEPAPDGSGQLSETQFNRYERLGGGWIAVEVIFKLGGSTRLTEEYAEVRGDVALPEGLFDAAAYAPPAWVSR